jgi:protein-disulfide isomerase
MNISRRSSGRRRTAAPASIDTIRGVVSRLAIAVAVAVSLTPAMALAQPSPQQRVPVVLFSDFQCPYCARVGAVLEEAERRFPGRMQVVFKHMPLPIHPQAPLAHEAALEAEAQGRFQQMHDLLFANQSKLDVQSLIGHAGTIGLDKAAFERALAERRHRAVVERDLREAQALGVNATPTLFVNGRKLVGVPSIEVLSAAITGAPEPTTAVAPVPVDRISLAGAPVKGPADAPITIVEYSDLQCGFCARAATTVSDLVRGYEGKVRWVFKHYPLDFHRDAMLAHQFALAAGEQGKFWEMHDAIFASQHAMKRQDLLPLATSLGLDVARLEKDVDSGRFVEVIRRDLSEGAGLGVDGTPTFFINGHRLVGAQPPGAFKAIIDRELSGAAQPTTADDAPPAIVLEWFADLRNPLSRDAAAQIRQLRAQYGRQMTVVFRHRPLEGREASMRAHEALLAADEQGKFWEMHDLLLVQQWVNSAEQLIEHAGRLGLDPVRFTTSLASGRYRAAIQSDIDEAKARDVRGTPVFFVNGKRFDGLVPLDDLRRAIDAMLAPAAAVK